MSGGLNLESLLKSAWFPGSPLGNTLASLLLLLGAIGAGIAVILWLRRGLVPRENRAGNGRPGMGESGRGDWENMLAHCKNLRDQGVLSEEEFRKVRTLAGPLLRFGAPELRARRRPSTDPAGPEAARK